jgi:hypothetical protein
MNLSQVCTTERKLRVDVWLWYYEHLDMVYKTDNTRYARVQCMKSSFTWLLPCKLVEIQMGSYWRIMPCVYMSYHIAIYEEK